MYRATKIQMTAYFSPGIVQSEHNVETFKVLEASKQTCDSRIPSQRKFSSKMKTKTFQKNLRKITAILPVL